MDSTLLYLDTARLGRMTPRAQQAHFDFARLAGEEGGSFHFERFLRRGAEGGSHSLAGRYPGLAGWTGIGGLKESLRSLAKSQPELPVLVASRSAQLMRLAARLLVHRCHNVLTSDLGWPSYHDILVSECRSRNQAVTMIALRDAMVRGQMTVDEVVASVRDEFLRRGCDGLFLTAVSNLGYRLPVERIVRAVEAVRQVWFVVIDGAQEFAHVSADLRHEYCDLYLAGCHKWLGAYHPMGLGFYGRRRSRSFIETVLSHLLGAGELDDPLLRFSTQLETDALDGTSETVGLASLFSCQGAVADALEGGDMPSRCLPGRVESLMAAATVAASAGWRPLLASAAFRTGILLLQAEREKKKELPAPELRRAFSERGVALTAYDGGIIRLSMPGEGWRPGEIEQLQGVLAAVA